MRVVPFFSLLIFFSESFSQTDSITNSIFTTKKYRPGIYKTYSQFSANTPIVTSGYSIKIDSGAFVRYWLYDEKGKKIRNMYGFSDGNTLFLNAKVYGEVNYFVPLLSLGQIIYFEDKIGKSNQIAYHSGLMSFGLVGGVAAYLVGEYEADRNPGWIIFHPDADGNAYLLSAASMRSILKEYDKELFDEFKRESIKDTYGILIKYLLKFNTKHPVTP